jgi:hypothetical protein
MPAALIEDTVPAEWSFVEFLESDGEATAGSVNKKKTDKSATKIRWQPDPEAVSSWSWRRRAHGLAASTPRLVRSADSQRRSGGFRGG